MASGPGASTSNVDSEVGPQDMQDIEVDEDTINTWSVKSRKQVRRNLKRKIREGSVDILGGESSSDELNSSIFHTPRVKPQQLEEKKVYIVPIDTKKSLRNVNLIKISKDIQGKCGSSPEFIKPIKSGVLVKCWNVKQYQALLNIEQINNIPVKAQKETKLVKGVISGIPNDMTEQELQDELKKQKVVGVKRIMRKAHKRDQEDMEINGQKLAAFVPTRSIILSFDTNSLPENITLCYQRFTVKQYVPPVVRCFQCQRFGHTAQQCRGKARCVRCGGPHSFDQCERKENPICVNCGEKHSAAYNGCLEAKKAKELQKIRVENKLSYAEATKAWKEKNVKPTNNNEQSQTLKVNVVKDQSKQTNSSHTKQLLNPQREPSRAPEISRAKEQIIQQKSQQSTTNELGTNVATDRVMNSGNEGRKNNDNFLITASSEEIVIFITQLVVTLVTNKPQEECANIIKEAVHNIFLKNVNINNGTAN